MGTMKIGVVEVTQALHRNLERRSTFSTPRVMIRLTSTGAASPAPGLVSVARRTQKERTATGRKVETIYTRGCGNSRVTVGEGVVVFLVVGILLREEVQAVAVTGTITLTLLIRRSMRRDRCFKAFPLKTPGGSLSY